MRVEGQIVINRPVGDVFECVADERNEPKYNPRLRSAELMSAEPIGIGSRFRALAGRGARPVEMTIELTGFERPRRLASVTRMRSMDIEGSLTFDPIPQGTLMRWSWDLKPHGLLKLLSPLITRIGRRQEAACWAGLKMFLERQTN